MVTQHTAGFPRSPRGRKRLTLQSAPDCKVIMGLSEAVSHAAKIGQVAQCNRTQHRLDPLLRKQGLLERSRRSEGGFRLFGANDIETLKFVRKAQELEFSLNQIRELFLGADQVPYCSNVKELVDQKLTGVGQKITEVRSLELSLKRALRECKHELKMTALAHENCCPVLEEITRGRATEAKHENRSLIFRWMSEPKTRP